MSADPWCTEPRETPRANARGRTDLRYRIGTWSTFRSQMVRQLSLQPGDPTADPATAARPLAELTTRSPDDPTISLLDAWACVCDILTFYGERILNEGYLATATERHSVTEIARSAGYRPDPGRAATAPFAFTIDTNVDDEVVVPFGQPVLSVPRPDEVPQTFELVEELLGWAAWNMLRPRRTRTHTIERDTDQLYLDGVNTRLAVGDPIVVLGAERGADSGSDVTEHWDLRFVVAVDTFAPADTYADRAHTVVTLDHGLGDPFTDPAAVDIRLITFGNRAGLFGWNAPDARMMSTEIQGNAQLMSGGQWRQFDMADDITRANLGSHVVDLDQEYPGIVADSWVCLHGPTQVELFRVTKANPASRTEFSLSSRVTRLFLDADEHLDDLKRRSTTVLCESRPVPIAERPDDSPVAGFDVLLDGLYPAMPLGRRVIVRGELDSTGEPAVIETTVTGWLDDASGSTLSVATSLPALRRHTVEVLGNVAPSTHGATVAAEVLGHGDASQANQRMPLRHAPLTWVPAAPTGADPALTIRVGGVEWHRVDTFFGAGPNDHVYTVERIVTDDAESSDGPLDPATDHTVVTFGDGRRGARLPTGFDNVVAHYRFGLGTAGNLDAHQLTVLQQRPAAVRAATNPVAPTGGADPAQRDEIRRFAPIDALTLDRLVAIQDYEDHAASFPSIGLAVATELWTGRRSIVHVTAALADGEPLHEFDPTAVALVESMDALKDPAHSVMVWGHEPVPFAITLRLRVVAGALFSEVRDEVTAALLDAFAFPRHRFGQPVTAAQIAAIAHDNPLVHAIDIDHLHRVGQPAAVHEALAASSATWDGTTATKAELFRLDASNITISPLDVA